MLKVLHKVDIDNDGQLSKNELVKHIHKALYAMDEEEAEDEFIDADIDGDDRGIFSFVIFKDLSDRQNGPAQKGDLFMKMIKFCGMNSLANFMV